MKRIIDGVTYNTDTSTVVARAETVEPEWGGNPEERKKFTLYQTRGGAFFVHTHIEWTVLNRRTEEPEERERDVFVPMTRDEAHKWIMEGEVELMNDVFGEPPEAAEEAAPSSTLYVRVPAALAARASDLAKSDGVSLNAWTMRCVERCAELRVVGELLGDILQTGQALDAEPERGAYSEATVRQMVSHICEQTGVVGRKLGWSAQGLDELRERALMNANYGIGLGRQWKPYEDGVA